MSEAEQRAKKVLHFGGFTLNLERRGLYRGDERVHLTSKPLETLIFLVENRNTVVEKQTLLDVVWKGTFVTEDVLVQSVREIRRALGDDKGNPLFIQTVPRQGYRFVGEVSAEPPVLAPPLAITAAETTQALASAPAPAVEVGAHRARPARRRMWLVLVVLVPMTTVLWLVSRPDFRNWVKTRSQVTPREVQTRTKTLLPTGTGKYSAGKPALSPDGQHLLFISSTEGTEETTADGKLRTYGDVFVKKLADGQETIVTDRENPSGDLPVFTADGTEVVFSNYRHTETGTSLPNLYRVLSSGGVRIEQSRLYIREASGAGFSPDNKSVAYTKHLPSQKALWLSPAKEPEKKHDQIAPTGFTPRWSWDGKLIAYTTSNPNGGLGDIWVIDADTLTGARNLTNDPQQIYGLTWTPDGQSLIYASKKTGSMLLYRVSINDGVVQTVSDLSGDYAAPSMSRVSNLLVFSRYQGEQKLMQADGLAADAKEFSGDEYHKWSRISPSGLYVASVMEKPDTGKHLYVTDNLGHHIKLSDLPAHHPCWAGEKKLAYLHWDKDAQQTQVLEVDISDLARPQTRTLHTFSGVAEWLAVDPSGTKLAVVLTDREGNDQIVLRDPQRTNEQFITIAKDSEYANLRWSPDGSTLAWSGREETGHESNGIWVIKPLVEPQRRVVANGYGPVWSPDGSTIYFSRIEKLSGLWQVDVNSGRESPTPIREWHEVSFFDIVGQRLVYCQLGSRGKSRLYTIDMD